MELTQHSDWYNANLEEIVAAAEAQSEKHVGIGATLTKLAQDGIVAVIEDDLGDVAFATPNCIEVFGRTSSPREATTDYLPEHARGFHRRLHRRSVKSLMPDEYELTTSEKRWTVEFLPFREQGEEFTLTLFSNKIHHA
jgi:hypothetical protein